MRKRGKHFTQRRDPEAAMRVFAGFRRLSDSQLTAIGLTDHGAFDRLRTGRADDDDMHTMAAALNVGMIMCEQGFGEEYLDEVKAAQQDLLRIYQRGKADQRWTLDAQALATLRRAFELRDEQNRICTQGEIKRALNGVIQRITSGHVETA